MHSAMNLRLRNISILIKGSLVESCRMVHSTGTYAAAFQNKSHYKKVDRRKSHFMKTEPNAGIRHQMKMIEDEDQQMVEELGQFGDSSELDIYKADQLYDKHTRDDEKMRERLKHQIVGHKYFRPEKEPNVLTWAEKEHLRHLHATDKETHNPLTLAESFNISVETVKKILKARWLPEDETRIKKHDGAVLNNRKQLGLPTPTVLLPLQANTEVSELVAARLPNSRRQSRETQPKFESVRPPHQPRDPQNDTMIEGVIENRKRISFLEFRKSAGLVAPEARTRAPRSNDDQREGTEKSRLEDIAILKYFDNNSELKRWISSDETVTINIDSPRDSDKLAAYFYDSSKGYQHPYGKEEAVPKKINISAKNKTGKGLYRQGDSFYDSEGEFLYRVPHLFTEK